jgi:hypothetical protein
MKAITLTQPWASLVAIGEKKIETRSWRTNYRGPLAIHAAKGFPYEAKVVCFEEPFQSILLDHGFIKRDITFPGNLRFPFGAILGTCELFDVVKTDSWVWFGKAIRGWENRGVFWTLDNQEIAFGDYSRGRFAWLLYDLQMFPEPILAKGSLGLWECNGINV